MGVFDFLKKRKSELSREQKKWNKMWDLWAEHRADTPYAEVMTYQSEVNNGGHDQYFFNVEQTGDLPSGNFDFGERLIRRTAKQFADRV